MASKKKAKRKAAVKPKAVRKAKAKSAAPRKQAAARAELTPVKPKPAELPTSITALLDSCPLGVAISSVAEAKIVYANVPMARFFGITRVAAHGKHVADFYSDPNDREYVRAMLASKGVIYRYRMRGKAADGSERSARLSAHVIAYNGEPAILSWIEDETETAQRERAMHSASAQVDLLRQIAGIGNRAVNFFDALRKSTAEIARAIGWPAGLAYRFAHGDDGVLELAYLSLPKDRLEYESLRKVLMGRAFHAGEDLPGRALASKRIDWVGDVAADLDIKRFSPSDSVRIRSALAIPIVAEDRVIAVVELLSDETMPPDEITMLTLEQVGLELGRVYLRDQTTVALQEARAEAESSSRAKASFLAAMSHEVRTPMNGVVGMVDLVLQTRLDDEQRFMLQTVKDSGQALITVINDILDFSKIEAGRLEIESAEFSIAKTLEDVALSLAPAAAQKGLSLVAYADPELPELVLGDAVRVRQILSNLGSNAVKFSERGEILLKAEPALDHGTGMMRVRFSVRDEGVGIAADVRDRLFQEFQQADSSTTRRFGGTGLGLAICRRLTDLMQGEIGVDSLLGVGSEFHCTLPFAPAERREKDRPGVDLSGLRVLIIADSAELRAAATRYLTYWKANVQAVPTLRECMAHFQDAKKNGRAIDIVLIARADDLKQVAALRQGFVDAGLMPYPRFVIGRDSRSDVTALRQLSEVTLLDINPMRRAALISAVAVAAGRASPETPTLDLPDPGADRPVPTVEEALARGRLILVAEDHVSNQEVVRRQLNRLGYACEMAEDGVQALAMWRKKDYALLLTDCHMPKMDGFGLTAAIRHDEEKTGLPHKPIIAITANVLQGEAERCLGAGMDGFLPKPVDLKTMAAALDKWLGGDGGAPASLSTPVSDDLPVLDLTQVREVYGEIDDEVRRIYSVYLDSVRPLLARFQDELSGARHADARETIHKARGATANAGGKELAALMRDIEKDLAESRYTEALERTRAILPAWERLTQAIARI